MYIGATPQIGNYQVCDAISASATATYALTVSSVAVFPESANHVICSLNGVIQKPGSSFSISSSNIVFSSALTSSDSIDFIVLLGSTLDVGVVSDGAISNAKLGTDIISGETDIGGALADADLLLVDDGAGGTLRKSAMSRIKTYVDAETNTPAFAATSSSQSGIASGTITKMQFDTEIFDSASAFDHSSNYRFTVPSGEGGKYVFMFQAKMRSGTLHNVRDSDILLRKNGSTISSNNSTYNQNLALQYHTDAFYVVDASASDYFEVWGQGTIDSGTLTMSNGGFKLTA
jgi:hypothetical protein